MNTLIISPTYNEKKNITSLVDSIFNINKDYHVLIIVDNSPDGTADLVKNNYQDSVIVKVRPKK